jgi:hypothetical protein
VVYVSKDPDKFDATQFSWERTQGIVSRAVVGKTELIIPDEWPEFPAEPGTYYVGVTSKDDLGNQSDPFVSSGVFRFVPLPPPTKGGIESL